MELGIDLIAKIFGLGIVVTVADMVLAQAGRKDIAYGITLAAIALVLGVVVKQIYDLFENVSRLFKL